MNDAEQEIIKMYFAAMYGYTTSPEPKPEPQVPPPPENATQPDYGLLKAYMREEIETL